MVFVRKLVLDEMYPRNYLWIVDEMYREGDQKRLKTWAWESTAQWDAFMQMSPEEIQQALLMSPLRIARDVAGFGFFWVEFMSPRKFIQWRASEYHFDQPMVSWWRVNPVTLGFMRVGRRGPPYYWYSIDYWRICDHPDFVPYGPLKTEFELGSARVEPLPLTKVASAERRCYVAGVRVPLEIFRSPLCDLWVLCHSRASHRKYGPVRVSYTFNRHVP